MEAGNAVLIPLLVAYLVEPEGWGEIAGVALLLVASCSLLLVGATYWRAALCRLSGIPVPMRHALWLAVKLKNSLLALSLAPLAWAIFLCIAES